MHFLTKDFSRSPVSGALKRGFLLLPRLLEVLKNQATSAAAPFAPYRTQTLSRAKCSWSLEKNVPSPGHLPALLRASARRKSPLQSKPRAAVEKREAGKANPEHYSNPCLLLPFHLGRIRTKVGVYGTTGLGIPVILAAEMIRERRFLALVFQNTFQICIL